MTGLAARLTPPSTIAYPGEHLGLRWRPMMPADGPAVYDLVRRIEITDRSSMATTPPEVADLMEGSHGVDLVDSVVGIDAEGTIAAVASVRVLTRVTEMAVALVKAHIDPHWRGRVASSRASRSSTTGPARSCRNGSAMRSCATGPSCAS